MFCRMFRLSKQNFTTLLYRRYSGKHKLFSWNQFFITTNLNEKMFDTLNCYFVKKIYRAIYLVSF